MGERRDCLRAPSLQHFEIADGGIRHVTSAFVGDISVDLHEVDAGANRRCGLRRNLRRKRRLHDRGDQADGRRSDDSGG